MAAHQASPSLGFSRQEYWSGLPFSYIKRQKSTRQFFHLLLAKRLILLVFLKVTFIFNPLLCSISLIFATHQHTLAIGVHMSHPSWTSLPPPTLSHPSRLLQSPSVSSFSHRANFHWLSISHVYMLLSLIISFSPSFPLPLSISLFSMSLWESLV